MRIINYLRVFINRIVFAYLQNASGFSTSHILSLSALVATAVILGFVYRFMVSSQQKRMRYVKVIWIIACCLQLFFLIYVEVIVNNLQKVSNAGTINIAHMLYSLCPLNLTTFSLILLGFAIYKNQPWQWLSSFIILVTPLVGLNNLLFIDTEIVNDSFFAYYFVNGVLLFAPIYLALFGKIRPTFKGMVISVLLLVAILILSECLNVLFAAIAPHSRKNQIYNLNYASNSFNVPTQIIKHFNHPVFALLRSIIPIDLLYLIPALLLMMGIDTLIYWIFSKPSDYMKELKLFFAHPVRYIVGQNSSTSVSVEQPLT